MNDCEKLIQFDTTAISNNLATQFSALRYINQDNYEEMKERYGIDIPEYFSGDYDNFKKKRNQLTQLFISSGFTSLQQNYYHHGLSADGAKAYAECVARTTNQPIAAWVAGVTEDRISIGISCGLGGTASVRIEITGTDRPINSIERITANGEVYVMFEYNHKKDFFVIINSTVEGTGGQYGAKIDYPKIRNFEIRKERKEITGEIAYGGGGNGNISNDQYSSTIMLVADPDYYILPETLNETSRKKLEIFGVRAVNFSWIEDKVDDKVKRLIGNARDIAGESADRQANMISTWSVVSERQYLVEI